MEVVKLYDPLFLFVLKRKEREPSFGGWGGGSIRREIYDERKMEEFVMKEIRRKV